MISSLKSKLQIWQINLLVALLLLLALTLRLTWLDIIPAGFNWDETAYAYNAYAIQQSFQDEFGQPWPLFLQSFGDYKPALLSYILAVVFQFFSPNVLTARITMIVISVAGLWGAWLFWRKQLGGMAAAWMLFTIALAPIHLHYSRAVMDPMLGFSLMMLGWGLIVAKNKWWQLLGGILLGLSMYAYNSQRLVVPLLSFIWWLLFIKQEPLFSSGWWRQPKKYWLQLPVWWLPVFFIAVCLVLYSLFGHANSRAAAVLFTNTDVVQFASQDKLNKLASFTAYSSKFVFTGEQSLAVFTQQLLQHVDIKFWFLKDSLSPRHGFGEYGNLLLVTAPFWILGLLFYRRQPKTTQFYLWWLVLGALPAALSSDVPHSGRALIMLPAMIYFILAGLLVVSNWATSWRFSWRARKIIERYVYCLFFILLTANSAVYWRDLYLYFPEQSHLSWQGELEQVVRWVKNNKDSYQHVYFETWRLDPTIFYAWYNLISPKAMQEYHAVQLETGVRTLDGVDFVNDSVEVSMDVPLGEQMLLITARPLDLPLVNVFSAFNRYEDGELVYYAYRVKYD